MLVKLTDLPQGVIGFESQGPLTKEDYTEVMVPTIDAAAQDGKVRLVYVVGPDFGIEHGAVWQDLKLGMRDWSRWERLALVTDHDWMRTALQAFGWMVPGEVRAYRLAERDEAVQWVAG
jgi:hypothetical protein